LRSHSTAFVWWAAGVDVDVDAAAVVPSGSGVVVAVVVVISTTKTPPVAGCRATSPREREKVERSSWAYWDGVSLVVVDVGR
jgi:hypothetical protein